MKFCGGGALELRESGLARGTFGLGGVPGDSQIAQGGHGAGSRAIADAAAILVKAPIAPVVELIFDSPMLPGEFCEPLWGGGTRFKAGDEIDGLLREATVLELAPAIDASDLRGEGKVNLRRAHLAAEDCAFLQPPMAFFNLAATRGKKRSPAGGARNAGAGKAGCL